LFVLSQLFTSCRTAVASDHRSFFEVAKAKFFASAGLVMKKYLTFYNFSVKTENNKLMISFFQHNFNYYLFFSRFLFFEFCLWLRIVAEREVCLLTSHWITSFCGFTIMIYTGCLRLGSVAGPVIQATGRSNLRMVWGRATHIT
jgi:hypothetical protein